MSTPAEFWMNPSNPSVEYEQYCRVWRAARALRPTEMQKALEEVKDVAHVASVVCMGMSVMQGMFSAFVDKACRPLKRREDKIGTGWCKDQAQQAFYVVESTTPAYYYKHYRIVPLITSVTAIRIAKSRGSSVDAAMGAAAGKRIARHAGTGRVMITMAAAHKRLAACIDTLARALGGHMTPLFKRAMDCFALKMYLGVDAPSPPPHPVVLGLGLGLPRAETLVAAVAADKHSTFGYMPASRYPPGQLLRLEYTIDHGAGFGMHFLEQRVWDTDWWSIEMLAARSGRIEGLKALYKCGVRPCKRHWTVLDEACSFGQLDVAKFAVEELGIDPGTPTRDGGHGGPLDIARDRKQVGMVKFLLGFETVARALAGGRASGEVLAELALGAGVVDGASEMALHLMESQRWDVPHGEKLWCDGCQCMHDHVEQISREAGRTMGHCLLIAAHEARGIEKGMRIISELPGASAHVRDMCLQLLALEKPRIVCKYEPFYLPEPVVVHLLRRDMIAADRAKPIAVHNRYKLLMQELVRVDASFNRAFTMNLTQGAVALAECLLSDAIFDEKQGERKSKRMPETCFLADVLDVVPGLRRKFGLFNTAKGVLHERDGRALSSAIALLHGFVAVCAMDRDSQVRMISIVDRLVREGMPVDGFATNYDESCVYFLHKSPNYSDGHSFCAEGILGRRCMTPLAFAAATGKLYLAAYLLLRGARLHPTYDDVSKAEVCLVEQATTGPSYAPSWAVTEALGSCSTNKLKRLLLDRSTDKHLEWAKYGMGCNFKRQLALVRFRDAVRVRAGKQ